MSRPTVDLPDPVAPTTATDSPGATRRSKPSSTGWRRPYPKRTSLKVTSPPPGGSDTGRSGSWIAGSVVSTSSTRSADTAARWAWATIMPSMRSGQMSMAM